HAEYSIRDFHVTGVQTCALPILVPGVTFGKPSTILPFASYTLTFTGLPSLPVMARLKLDLDGLGYAFRESTLLSRIPGSSISGCDVITFGTMLLQFTGAVELKVLDRLNNPVVVPPGIMYSA